MLGSFFSHAGCFFLSQSAQSSRSFLAHISSPQNASGIQSSQNVTANEDTNKEAKSSLHPAHRGISVITPLPFGGGDGGGATTCFECCVFCSSVFSVRKNMSFFICHYVILSQKTDLSSFVIMSFCLKRTTCLPPSSCYSVLKTTPSVTPVLLCYPVSHTLSPPVLMLLCLKNHPICYLCLTLLPCLPYPVSPVLGYSVFQAEARGEESGKSFPAHGKL